MWVTSRVPSHGARALRWLVGLAHAFPAAKHLTGWWTSGAFDEAWKGWGAMLAITFVLAPRTLRTAALRAVARCRLIAPTAMALGALHLVPARDHLPRMLAAFSWADAWRGVGSAVAASLFVLAAIMVALRSRSFRFARVRGARFALSALLTGCAAASHDPLALEDGGVARDAGNVAPFVPSSDGGALGGNDGGTGDVPGATLLYAHTDTTLFSFDPTNMAKKPQTVGKFDCIGHSGEPPAMTDIGVTKDGKIFGVSQTAAYPLEMQPGGIVHCAETWSLPSGANFYGMTVAPENVLGANEVLLAANNAGELYRIDASTGATTQVGTLGTDPDSGQPWALSGDIVLLANAGSPIGFATVRTCPGGQCSSTDTLVEIDPHAIKPGKLSVLKSVRGPVVRGAWCKNASSPSTFGSMFGIAAFSDRVYGFSRKGDVVEIDNNDGSGCLVAAYSTDHFAGAAVTTTAPVKAPPPK